MIDFLRIAFAPLLGNVNENLIMHPDRGTSLECNATTAMQPYDMRRWREESND
jgi:hypothetical protein